MLAASTAAAGTNGTVGTTDLPAVHQLQPKSTASVLQLSSMRDHCPAYINFQPLHGQVIATSSQSISRYREYANLETNPQQQQQQQQKRPCEASQNPSMAAELSNPRLNYMELDFTSGRGTVPLDRDFSRCCPKPPLAYVELDFRAMSALAATAQAERELPAASRIACGGHRVHLDRPASEPPVSSKVSSLGRLRASFAKSLTRFSLRRRPSNKASGASHN